MCGVKTTAKLHRTGKTGSSGHELGEVREEVKLRLV